MEARDRLKARIRKADIPYCHIATLARCQPLSAEHVASGQARDCHKTWSSESTPY